MKHHLGAAALALTAALAVPAFASAHGSVYKSSAKVGATLTDETRYFITNHGFSFVLRETNGLEGTKGMVAYNLIPSAWRTGKPFATVMAQGGTGVQPHATCAGAAVLETETAIRSWQGADPFYNYVPFQTTSAGLEDDPALWTATLEGQGVTAADLATVDSRTAKCAALGGTYTPADLIQSNATALATGTLAEAAEPLNEEIDALEAANATLTAEKNAITADLATLAAELTTLKAQGTTTVNANSTLSTQVATLNAAVAGTQSELAAARTQVGSLQSAATPIKLTVGSAKAKKVAASGQTVSVIAAPSKAITVTVSVSEAQARKLKLSSSVLGKRTATTAADGTASVKVKVSKAAAKALKGLKRSLSTTIDATSGDRFATAKSKLTR